MTAIGVWPVCAASNRLYRRVWFLWCVKRSKCSSTNITLWLLWLPKRERQRERERERERGLVLCVGERAP